MKHGSDWYKREPTAFLGGVQGLSAKEHAVYSIIIDLIYQHGGSVNDDPAWFAGWISDMGSSAVRKTVDALVERGKLIREGDQLTNKRAKNEAKTKENLSETRAKSGRNGGISSGKSRSVSTENKDLGEASISPREEKRREEKKEEKKKDAIASQKDRADLFGDPVDPAPKIARRCQLPDGWIPSEKNVQHAIEKQLSEIEIENEADRFRDYHRGKGSVMLDWDAAWRTWIGNFKRRAGGSGFPAGPYAARGRQGDSLASIAAERQRRRQD